jgi:acetyltransferase-like isoleucine patch superfamily enzyme
MNVRRWSKRLARGIARLGILPMYVSYRFRRLLLGDRAFQATSQIVSLLPGIVGSYLRVEFYRLALEACAAEVHIGFGTLFASRSATIGEQVYVGSYCMIADAHIERDVLLGSNVHVGVGRHAHGTQASDRPIRLQAGRPEMIRIGENTWIGNGAIVMASVGKGCVIGAGSVVVAEIPDGVVAVGNPARVLRRRSSGVTGSGWAT